MKSDLIYEKTILDPTLCDRIIKAHNSVPQEGVNRTCACCNNEIKRSKDTGWKFIASQVHPWLLELDQELTQGLKEYHALFPHACLEGFGVVTTLEGFNVQSYDLGEGYPAWHHEIDIRSVLTRCRYMVWMLYLNDVSDGGTEFLYQDRVVQAEKGKLVLWPAFFTHTHRGVISHTTKKYIATGWCHYT